VARLLLVKVAPAMVVEWRRLLPWLDPVSFCDCGGREEKEAAATTKAPDQFKDLRR
jgi:hypothetical protein